MEDKEFDYMNVIPLVDVMMVLLTIVLTTSTFIASGVIPVSLPKTKNPYQDAPKAYVISIDRDGRIYLDRKELDLERLKEELVYANRESPILVRADREIKVQRAIDVLDVVYGMGFKKVALQTERGKESL